MVSAMQVDAAHLAHTFSKHCFQTVLAVNELVVLPYKGVRLVIRVTAANTLDAATREVSRFAAVTLMPLQQCRTRLTSMGFGVTSQGFGLNYQGSWPVACPLTIRHLPTQGSGMKTQP